MSNTDKKQPFNADGDYAPSYVNGPNGFRFQCYNAVKMAAELNALFAQSASRPTVGERAVSFQDWWDAQSDELFIVPSHAIKGWAWKAWNAALDNSPYVKE